MIRVTAHPFHEDPETFEHPDAVSWGVDADGNLNLYRGDGNTLRGTLATYASGTWTRVWNDNSAVQHPDPRDVVPRLTHGHHDEHINPPRA